MSRSRIHGLIGIYKYIIAQSTEARKTKKKKKLKVPLKCDIYGSFVQVLMVTWEILPPMYLMYLCTSLYLGTSYLIVPTYS